MKVITIKQPYATLIAENIKEYEFRTWSTQYRGEIYIQASKNVDKKKLEPFNNYNFEYPSGCIIAKAKLTDCILVDENFIKTVGPTKPLVYKNILEKKEETLYAFKLENVEKIDPIPIKGQLGIWNTNINIK